MIGVQQSHIIAISVTTFIVFCCVLMHFESLRLLTNLLKKLTVFFRIRVLVLIFGLLTAHLAEVCLFAVGYWFIDHFAHIGYLYGVETPHLLDYVYFSVVTYSTLGYGDIVPVGAVRFLSGMEAMTGMMMVAWSASFTFLEMRLFWRDN